MEETDNGKKGTSFIPVAIIVALVLLSAVTFMNMARFSSLEGKLAVLEAQVAPPDGYHLELMTIWRVCDPAVSNGALNESECPRVLNAGLARYYVYGNLSMGGFR